MEAKKKHIIEGLEKARRELLEIPKSELEFEQFLGWYRTYSQILVAGDKISKSNINHFVTDTWAGLGKDIDKGILEEIRSEIIELLIKEISKIDSTEKVRPVLEENILKVKDSKLRALLTEFNNIKDSSPNLAAIGFRTILVLIISERAKLKIPNSNLAKKDDVKFEPDINSAIGQNIFESGDIKALGRFLTGGQKDRFDNVAHKKGANMLADKDHLSDAVDLLNQLLPTIIS